MPKIRDLGINVIPETMRPPEIGEGGAGGEAAGGGGEGGGGGGGEGCQASRYECPAGTFPCTPGTFNPCTPGTINCYQYTYGPCTPGTYYKPGPDVVGCPAGTFQNSVTCYAEAGVGTVCPTILSHLLTCTPGTVDYGVVGGGCTAGTLKTTPQLVQLTTPQTSQPAGYGLTREAIALLKQQLHEQMAALDDFAKSFPSTTEEIDAREQQLKAELEELAAIRKRLEGNEG